MNASRSLRQLFRSLHDVRALRNNALALPFFASLGTAAEDDRSAKAALHAAVIAAARALRGGKGVSRDVGERRYRAIVDCDLGGEPAERVASGLGISLRQFRRERRIARECIARTLGPVMRSRAVTTLPDRNAIDLVNAQRLREAGRTQAAITLLNDIARESSDLFHQVDALSSAAEIAHDCTDPAAPALLRLAHARLGACDENQSMRVLAECRVEVAGWTVGSGKTGASDGPPDYDRLIERLSRAGALEGRRAAADFFGKWLIERASYRVEQGNFEKAWADVVRALDLIADGKITSPSVSAEAFLLQGNLAMTTKVDLEESGALLSHAFDFAERHGLTRLALYSGMFLAYHAYQRGDFRRGLADARNYVTLAESLGLPGVIAALATSAGSLEIDCGRYERARPHLALAQRHARPGSTDWLRMTINTATLELCSGNPLRALEYAREAESVAVSCGNRRVEGAALRTRAESELALGRRSRATRTIARALDVLERSGTRNSLALAYEASGRIAAKTRLKARPVRPAHRDTARVRDAD